MHTSFKNNDEKVSSSKIKRKCNLSVCTRTIRRILSKKLLLKYKKIKQKDELDQRKRGVRIQYVQKWINDNHDWSKTICSDEKLFSLDGPDDWMTWVSKNESMSMQKRVCGGGKVMVWLMSLPNGLISHKIIKGPFTSGVFLDILKNRMLGVMKLNKSDFILQFDNCAVP